MQALWEDYTVSGVFNKQTNKVFLSSTGPPFLKHHLLHTFMFMFVFH